MKELDEVDRREDLCVSSGLRTPRAMAPGTRALRASPKKGADRSIELEGGNQLRGIEFRWPVKLPDRDGEIA